MRMLSLGNDVTSKDGVTSKDESLSTRVRGLAACDWSPRSQLSRVTSKDESLSAQLRVPRYIQ
jgi:hypothetical protein